MTARRGYPAVDRFRVAAALLVVCIHTAPLASFSAAADAGHNFYQIGSNKWTDATHIQFTFDHE